MRQKCLILLVSAVWATVGSGARGVPPWVQEQIQSRFQPRPPLTLEEKVNDADLIVQGKATLLGEEKWVMDFDRIDTSAYFVGSDPEPDNPLLPFTVYERQLRVEVAQVFWPPSLQGVSNIVFNCYIVKKWPPSWWAYTNTAGIFFLSRGHAADKGEWTKLDQLDRDDWIEPTGNAAAVQTMITRIKVRGEQPLRQPNGSADRSQLIRSGTNSTPSAAGSRR